MHQKIKFIPMKIHKTIATRAAPFGPDMHQIVCRLGLRPRPHWGSLQRSPDPLAGLRGPTSKGRGGKGRERKGRALWLGIHPWLCLALPITKSGKKLRKLLHKSAQDTLTGWYKTWGVAGLILDKTWDCRTGSN